MSATRRTARTSALAFAKFKKIAQAYFNATEPSFSLTQACYNDLQKVVEAVFVTTLVATVDTMPAKTLSVKDVERTRAFLRQFATGVATSQTLIDNMASIPVELPKKMGVRNLKDKRPKTRITREAIYNMGLLYTDLIKIAIGCLVPVGDKKRLQPEEMLQQLAQVACFVA